MSSDTSDSGVFRYFDGARHVYGDPLYVQNALARELRGQVDQVVLDCNSQDDLVATTALRRLLDAVRVAFEMPPFDRATGQGATDRHCRDAYDALTDFFGLSATSVAETPSSPPSTAPAS